MRVPPVDRSPQWRPLGANLYSTGASGAVPVRPIHAVNAVESIDKLGEGVALHEPDRPSAPDKTNRDWTVNETEKEKPAANAETQFAAKEPLHKQVVELIQTMWRPSPLAVDMADEVNRTTLQQRMAEQVQNDQPLTYINPSVKRTGG